MAPGELVLRWLEIIVASIVILAAMKSAYNGFISRMIENVKRIEAIDNRTREMESRQESIAEGLVAIAYVVDTDDEEADIDSERIQEEVGVEQNVGKYVASENSEGDIPDFYRGGGHRSEDPPPYGPPKDQRPRAKED